MHLREISLKGFKSFPDRTKLRFEPGVSVIVGPNGCGKSNITDSILWALGEQSPAAVRGQSMQDVIFSGGKNQSRRRAAEVEVVIDNADGRSASEFSEIAITRKIDSEGNGEYRLNGARCRLADVIEALADTGLGREMHSVVSQGRVEAIISSKPIDRRLLIEEAAGLGKHRKRRRRAELKLERTRENLDRALDVEREARSRLRPLKAQAEAAERQAKISAQRDELQFGLLASDAYEVERAAAAARSALEEARKRSKGLQGQLDEVRRRRNAAEERIAAGERGRLELADRLSTARAAVERTSARAEFVRRAERELRASLTERQMRLEGLDSDSDESDDPGERVEALSQRLAAMGAEGEAADAPVDESVREAAVARDAARAEIPRLEEMAKDAAASASRASEVRAATKAEMERASTRLASLAGELESARAKLAGILEGASENPLSGLVESAAGLERAVTIALSDHLNATVVSDRGEGERRLSDADSDATRAIIGRPAPGVASGEASPPCEGARRLIEVVEVAAEARGTVEALLASTWLVPDLEDVPESFDGVAVTAGGEYWDGRLGELRRLGSNGEDAALAARSRCEELAERVEQRRATEERARTEFEQAERAVAQAEAARESADQALREGRRTLDHATEEAERQEWLAQQRLERGGSALERARLEAELAAEKRQLERHERASSARRAEKERLERRMVVEERVLPQLAELAESLERAASALRAHADRLGEPGEGDRSSIAEELRECSTLEYELGGQIQAAGEVLTKAEVESSQVEQRLRSTSESLDAVAGRLGIAPEAADAPLTTAEREEVDRKLVRLERRSERIGPVNPLAEREYEEARERAAELAEQREDLEKALAELKSLIRRTDKEIAELFDQTFQATAKHFEEMAAELFPGGKGRLRPVELSERERGQVEGDAASTDADGPGTEPEPDSADDPEGPPRPEERGVEIEVTPAGKSMRRLSLMSGGEKSLVALAFLFAVMMARPCPFYVLDEVEAALDDLNIDRFLKIVRRFADRSQFLIVTHQKRTMDAADALYGVSMGADGVSKVISWRPPRDGEDAPPEHDAAVAAADAWSGPQGGSGEAA